MPFQKGNKLAKGRSVGSKNKSTDVQKFELQQMLFNIEDMKKDFQALDVYKKFYVRMKAMFFFYSRPTVDMTIDLKPICSVKVRFYVLFYILFKVKNIISNNL